MRTKRLLTYSAYAAHRGVSVEAVSKAVDAERISVLVDDKGRRWLEAELTDTEWNENSDPAKRIGGEAAARLARGEDDDEEDDEDEDDAQDVTGRGDLSYNKARARREVANAELAELKLAERRGQLVELAAVEKGAEDNGRLVREALMGIPDRLSGLLAGETDPHRVHLSLTDEIRRALEELTGDDGDS